MKMYAKRFLRDSLAIIYFIIGWKLGGCLLSEQPRRGEDSVSTSFHAEDSSTTKEAAL